ncbi:MAG: hypothetical protein CR962_00430 [Gammaproteobacteria bacterium]|nr:MAG: hypothetical protein CR962_00430 [Gammaproteobacteria bacterium]
MSEKYIFSALLLLTLAGNAFAFDASVFQKVDESSAENAKTFLALPVREAKELALKHVQLTGDEQTKYPWQLFLLTYLSNQTLTPGQWKQLQENSLLANLAEDESERQSQVIEEIAGQESSRLCFAQLQMTQRPEGEKVELSEDQEKQVSEQQNIFSLAQSACLSQLTPILQQEDVFNWYIGTVDDNRYLSQTIMLFMQNGLLHRLFFGARQGVSLAEFSDEQQQKLITAWLPYFLEKKNGHLFTPDRIANVLKSNDKKFSSKFIDAVEKELSEQPPTNEEKLVKILHGLLQFDSEKSSESFWKLAWKTPSLKDKLGAFKTALGNEYNAGENDKNFPEVLHSAARKLIKEDKDIRFADTYLFLVGETEGGFWNDEHIAAIRLLDEMAPDLADDAETQGVLKNTYQEAAAIEFFFEVKHLEKTKDWLDKASAIGVEPISWFKHVTGEHIKGLYQHEDFKSIVALQKKQQLSQLSMWVEHKKRPEKPFTDLPLDLYELFTDTIPLNRIWHNPENGHALILDDDGGMHYFDGYAVIQPTAEQLKIARIIPGDYTGEAEGPQEQDGSPTLTSSMDAWIKYAVRYFFGEAGNTPKLSSRGILDFANDAQPAQERLLFVVLHDGELSSYPEYLEYVRHGHEIMLMADVDSKINQYIITLPDEATAMQWMQDLAGKAPINTQKAHLWYKSSGSPEYEQQHGIMLREYVHSDDEREDKLLTALHPEAGFDYNAHGCSKFRADELEKHQKAFNQKELELYQQGYVLERIYHDESCVETRDQVINPSTVPPT